MEIKTRLYAIQNEMELVEKGGDFNPVNKKCQICLKEKFYIMFDTGGSTLNKREEVYNTCRHKRTKLLSHFKS